jgi:hypothetical protein
VDSPPSLAPGEPPTASPPPRRRALLVFAALAALFVAATYSAGFRLDPTARDQNQDLSLSIRIREGTALTDGNRHPLLPALLAPVMERAPEAFVSARLVALAVTALVVVAFFLGVSRVYSPSLALLAAVGWAFELRFQARRICPEPLLSALLVLSVAVLASSQGSRRRGRAAFVAGALLGLAWCAKGSALLSVAAAAAWLLVARRRAGVRDAALLLSGFVVAASPLLVWNTTHYGGPLYNVNSTHVQWEDGWDFDLDRRSTATISTYFATHGVGDAAARLAGGFLRQRGVEWVYAFLAVWALDLWRRRRAARRSDAPAPAPSPARDAWRGLALANAVAWLPPFAWYAPIVSERRLLFPVFALLIPPALDALARAIPGVVARLSRVPVRVATAAAVAVAIGAAAGAAFLVASAGDPYGVRPVDDASLRVVEVLSRPEFAGSRVLAKPSRTIPPDWLLEGRVSFVSLPAAVPDADVAAWIPRHADLVLENDGLAAFRPGLADALRVRPVEWSLRTESRSFTLRRVAAGPR